MGPHSVLRLSLPVLCLGLTMGCAELQQAANDYAASEAVQARNSVEQRSYGSEGGSDSSSYYSTDSGSGGSEWSDDRGRDGDRGKRGDHGHGGHHGDVINIDGRSYVAQSNNRGKGDGFYQNGKWYVRSDRNLPGQNYYRSNGGPSGGFNYNGNYYVAGGGQGGGGQGSGGGAHFINLGGNTYAGTNNRRNSGGFNYNGTYYEPWNRHVNGQRFVTGDPSRQKNGFWQNGQWWVPGH